jgi:2-hydroxychromene-2-carboxylate isomerase
MKTLTFSFDPISPYAYLAFMRLPQALEGVSHQAVYRPILFAGLLKHFGQLGPAEIAPKKAWTFRQVQWLAREAGLPMRMPAAHPFNPLGLLRLMLQAAPIPAPAGVSRFVAESVLRAVWESGDKPGESEQLAQLAGALRLAEPDAAVKERVSAQLRANTDAAIAEGVFGVPTIEVDGLHFWGADALPMLRAYLQGDAWFASSAWRDSGNMVASSARKESLQS